VRSLILLLLALLIAVVAAYFIHDQLVAQSDPGYVIVGVGHWSLESSLFVVGAGLVVLFLVFYGLVRLLVNAMRLPAVIRRRGFEQRSRMSQESLIAGLIESAEGNWEKAERHLIRHAADSGVPLINYLTAARAAQSRGAVEERDEYLKLAHESMPEAELAIGLTRAELQMSNQQFEDALASLTQLDKLAPSHARVLKMMHQAYAQIEDWESVSRIIPQMHRNKVMMEAEIKLLETETFSALLKKRAESRDADGLRQLWTNVPEHIKTLGGIQQLYAAAMIDAGSGDEVEGLLRRALDKEWSETLLVLYGCILAEDPLAQLSQAEAWLPAHRRDAVLLRVLGKLALRARNFEKAGGYLEESLAVEPSVEAYQLMGDLHYQQNNPGKACFYFRNGLLFASDEVVSQIEQNPEGETSEPEEESELAPSGRDSE
jgi:HemY protein